MSKMSQLDAILQESPNGQDLRREFDAYCNGQLTTEDLSDELKKALDSVVKKLI